MQAPEHSTTHFCSNWKTSGQDVSSNDDFRLISAASSCSAFPNTAQCNGFSRQWRVRDPSQAAHTAQPCHPVCLTGALWGGCATLQASARGSWEDQWPRSSRCCYHAQHPCSCLQVGGNGLFVALAPSCGLMSAYLCLCLRKNWVALMKCLREMSSERKKADCG